MTMYSKMFCNRNAGDKLNHKITSRLEDYNLQVITNMKVGLKLTLHDRSWRFNDDVWNARPTQRSGQLTNIKIFYVDLRGSRNDRAASLFAFPNIFFLHDTSCLKNVRGISKPVRKSASKTALEYRPPGHCCDAASNVKTHRHIITWSQNRPDKKYFTSRCHIYLINVEFWSFAFCDEKQFCHISNEQQR